MPNTAALTSRPIAHRGLHDAKAGIIENTVSAQKAAIERNHAIECDVQLTADGEAVVFHDFTLDRLTEGSGAVADFTAGALSAVPMRGTDDRIAPLASLLTLAAGRVPLVIEIKSGFDGDMRLPRRVLEIVKGYAGPFGLKSFDDQVVMEIRRLAPDIPRGIVAMADYGDAEFDHLTAERKASLANLLHFDETRPDFLSWHVKDLPSAAPYLCRSQLGLPVMTWTVRTAEDQARARQHADQMVFEGFVPDA